MRLPIRPAVIHADLDNFFEFLSDSFRPILGALLGASLFITFMSLMSTLGVTEGTVKQHLKDLFKRLNARNRIQAVNEATRLGLLRK